MRKLIFTLFTIAIFFLAVTSCQNGAADESAQSANNTTSEATASVDLPKYEFDEDGALKRLDADNYRRWIYVGTPLTPNDMNEPEAAFPEFHNVYIHPDDYNYWQKNGEWQDGTILVKELVLVGKKQEVSGNGYFMGDFTGLEVTIKDKKKYPNEPGNWAYYSFGHEYPLADVAMPFPTAACNTCHEASAEDDFVFTQDYPILRAAKNSKNKTMGLLQNQPEEKTLNNESVSKIREFLTTN